MSDFEVIMPPVEPDDSDASKMPETETETETAETAETDPESTGKTEPIGGNTKPSGEPVEKPVKGRGRKPKSTKGVDEGGNPRRGQGRPRSNHTIDRDQIVLKYLSENKGDDEIYKSFTRADLTIALGLEASLIYLSIYRLRRDGHVERTGAGVNARWSVIPGHEYVEPKIDETTTNTPDENVSADIDTSVSDETVVQ